MQSSESQSPTLTAPLHVLMVAFEKVEASPSFDSVFTSLIPSPSVDWVSTVQNATKHSCVFDQCDVMVLDCRGDATEWGNMCQVFPDGKHVIVLGVTNVSQNGSSHDKFVEDAIGYRVDESMAPTVLKWVLHQAKEHKQLLFEQNRLRNDLDQAAYKVEMADVASTVLHNVGNVLTSVTVAANVVESVVEQSSVVLVNRIAELLISHQQDLGDYLMKDSKGKRIPSSLEKLGAHLVEEQQTVLKEMQALVKNICHMKHIIASQQTMAKSAGQTEPIALVNALSHAIEMSFQPEDEKWVTIHHDYQEVPTIIADRHQLLQILVNLLRNAKQAMGQQSQGCHELHLGVKWQIPEKTSVVLTIQDSGIGIAPEHLSKMFTRGFTTKKDGNGIGLHSAIGAIQSMGGAMHVQSEGVGKGTMFTLTFPVHQQAVLPSHESVRLLLDDGNDGAA